MADRITVVGALGTDPEERSTSQGAVVQFRVASTDRRRDAQGNWSDGQTSWYRVNAWGELGRNALVSLRKGQRVIVAGDLSVSEWDGTDGHKNRSVEIRAVSLGHDLTFGVSRFERMQRAQQSAVPADTGRSGAAARRSETLPAAPAAPPVDHSGEWGVSAIGGSSSRAGLGACRRPVLGRCPVLNPDRPAWAARIQTEGMAEYIYPMVRARKAVGDKLILDDVTMSFFPGAKIGVVGPNGAGKSTILKIMAGLDTPVERRGASSAPATPSAS